MQKSTSSFLIPFYYVYNPKVNEINLYVSMIFIFQVSFRFRFEKKIKLFKLD